MTISKKGEYAIKALIELAIDHDRGITVTLINDVAQRKGIPQKYLEQILLNLRNAVSSVLDNTSLTDVVRRTLELIDRQNKVPSYAI